MTNTESAYADCTIAAPMTFGHDAMARENGTTLEQLHLLAAEFVRRSPDQEMKRSLAHLSSPEITLGTGADQC